MRGWTMFLATGACVLAWVACGPAVADGGATALTIYSYAAPGGVPFETYSPAMQQQMAGYYRPDPRQQLPGYAVVRQQRAIDLKEGVNQLRFVDVAALIDPTTVSFESLTDPQGTRVVDQSFEFDLVSADKLLEKYLDRPIRLTRNLGDGKIESFEATLLSYEQGQMVLRTADKAHPILAANRGNLIGIEFGELPGGLITKPTLVWNVAAEKGGRHDVRVAYQTKGIVWWADYNLILAGDEKTLDAGAWVSIINRSGATYEDAKLKLVAGDVHRAPEARPEEMMTLEARAKGLRAGAEGFEEKAFFEYHLYTLGRPATIRDNSTQQIELFPTSRGVPVEKVYVYYGLPRTFRWAGGRPATDRELGLEMNTKVDVYLRFNNSKENNMGMPLPSGRIRVSKADPADATLEFIGEDVIDHTPKDEKVLVQMGSAFDVVGERRQTDFQVDTSRRTIHESFEIKVRNHKAEPIAVIIKENLFRWATWEVTKASTDYEKIDHRTIHFPVKVEPDGETAVTYTVKYTW